MARPNTHHPHHTGRRLGCVACGCTDKNACRTADGPCWWVGPRLCSGCAKNVIGAVEQQVDFLVHRTAEMGEVEESLTEGFGATFGTKSGTERITLGGIAATCTAGGAGLLRAWVRAAYREIGKAAA